MVLLQSAVAYVFMQRHWELVTHRLSAAVARDVGAMVDLYSSDAARRRRSSACALIAAERFRMDVEADAAAAAAAAAAKYLLRLRSIR